VLRRILIGSAMAALVVAAVSRAAEPPAPSTVAPATVTPPVAIQPKAALASETTSCATTCQTEHDRCRIQRKGSPSCDAERQACLEKCLQKKSRR
jgi:hypothetical protein